MSVGKRVLVVGAGYVGMALLRYLQGSAHTLYATTTQSCRIEELRSCTERVFFLSQGDLRSFKEALDASDVIIVLLAPKEGCSYRETYLHTAETLTSLLHGRQYPYHLIYTSSTGVYEGVRGVAVEDMSLVPPTERGAILLEAENIFRAGSITPCILRLGGIYGPGRELAKRARRLSGKSMEGCGSEPTNNIFLEDIVSALCFSMDRTLQGIYNVVSDDHPSRRELYDSLCAVAGLPPPRWQREPAATQGYVVSNDKIKDCGFYFSHPHIAEVVQPCKE